jgi:hypothetical protein
VTRNDRKHMGGSGGTAVGALALCTFAVAACGSASAGSSPGAPPTASTSAFRSLPRCTSAQLAAASGDVRVLQVISGQTVHIAVGEQVNLAEKFASMRPASGQIQIRAAHDAVCQRADIQGDGNNQSLPLVIIGAGSTEITIKAAATEPGGSAHHIIYVDSAG